MAIEYGQTSPKLLGWLRPDPKTDRHSDTDPEEDDEDVAAEARRVEEMEGVLRDGEGGGEVILNNLRKVYRTKQASEWRIDVVVVMGVWVLFLMT